MFSGKKLVSRMFANVLLTERNSFPIRYIIVNEFTIIFAMKVYAKLLENKKNIQPIVYLQSNVSNLGNSDNFVHAFTS